MQILEWVYVFFLLSMLILSVLNLYLSLYVWEAPERLDQAASPKVYSRPQVSFTVLLPARHEEAVIGETIKRIAAANYPSELLEIFVICEASDTGTVAAAKEAFLLAGAVHAKVITFYDKPINKPHGLNVGLSVAQHESVVIFDAEDNVHPDIFNIANTIYQDSTVDIIQAGVQLMNYDSRWFSSHNVLEYYFWFRSRMHFHTRVGVVPLGGNTVFFKTKDLLRVGGWNEHCLTEDGEIGIRLSARGRKVVSTYDPKHVTKEETPATVNQFIKQRTRWNQGFIQILVGKQWLGYDGFFKRLFCLYTLSFPVVQAVLFFLTPVAVFLGLRVKMPIIITLLSLLPILLVVLQVFINCVALHEFIGEQRLRRKWRIFVLMIVTYVPYQLLLTIGALRATYRELRGRRNWEKTAHTGLHRTHNSADAAGRLVEENV